MFPANNRGWIRTRTPAVGELNQKSSIVKAAIGYRIKAVKNPVQPSAERHQDGRFRPPIFMKRQALKRGA